MNTITSFSDKFLIKAASEYAYDMSNFNLYKDPVLTVALNLKIDFLSRFVIEKVQNKAVTRNDRYINIRYILFKDTKTEEYALAFQGSQGNIIELFSGQDNDWSNNLSSAAHLKLDNYKQAKEEFDYLYHECGYKITAVTGNSLGGGYALNLLEYYPNIRALGVNPAPLEFNKKYTYSPHATVLLTSSDILSRLLTLDRSRYNIDSDEEALALDKIEKLTRIYGVKPTIIYRAIPYTSIVNIAFAHVGALGSYRDVIEELYNANSMYYNTKILSSTNKRLDFSKHLLKTQYQKLNQQDYLNYIDQHVYPALKESSQELVDSYKLYPELTDYIFFDPISSNINNEGYKIKDIQDFTNKNYENIEGYSRTNAFLINSSQALIKSLSEDTGLRYTKETFLTETLKIKLDWDWNLIKLFVGMPLSVKLKLGELIEKNWYFFFRLGNQINKEYQKFPKYDTYDIQSYTLELKSALDLLTELSTDIESMMISLANNFEMFLISGKKSSIELSLLEIIETKALKNLDSFSFLNKRMMSNQYHNTHEVLSLSKTYIEDNIDTLATSTSNIIKEIISSLSPEHEIERKLLAQFEGIHNNIDTVSFLTLLIYEFQNEIISLLLKDSVAMQIYSNLVQLSQYHDYLYEYIDRMKEYVADNLSLEQTEYMMKDYQKLEQLIENVNRILEILI